MTATAIERALLSLDRDTTGAIAAGVAAMRLGWKGIPVAWREALLAW